MKLKIDQEDLLMYVDLLVDLAEIEDNLKNLDHQEEDHLEEDLLIEIMEELHHV